MGSIFLTKNVNGLSAIRPRLLPTIFLFFWSHSVIANCPLSEDSFKNASTIFDTIGSVDSFKATYSSHVEQHGSVESYSVLHNYIVLRYLPEHLEEGMFIVSFDRSGSDYFIFHATGLVEPQQFYRGTVDLNTCSLNFDINSDDFVQMSFAEKGIITLNSSTASFVFFNSKIVNE